MGGEARLWGRRFCSLKAAFLGGGFACAALAMMAGLCGRAACSFALLRGEERRTAPTLHRPGGRRGKAGTPNSESR